MKELTEKEIEDNYNLHIKIIKKYIQDPDRQAKILAMIDSIGENYVLSPAAGKTWYHGAYPGGYIVHVNNVVRISLSLMKQYEKFGGTLDFTEEELVFSALFHDLGKLGDGEKVNYLVQTDNWRRDKLAEAYVSNEDLDFMLIPERSLFVLQKYGIKVNQKEYLAIKLHDGLFDETNKPYYNTFSPGARLKSNIVPILHAADFLASRLEFDIEHKQS